MSTKFVTPYNYKKENYKGVDFTEPTITKQSFKDECDINHILRRYQKNGQLPDLIKENPRFGDFSSPHDYQESMNIVAFANEQFAALPAKTRERFNNNPELFLEFVDNPQNNAELIKLGLAHEKAKPKPNEVLETLKDIKADLKESRKTKSKPDTGE